MKIEGYVAMWWGKMAMLDDGNSPSPAYNNALMEYVG